MKAFKIIVTLFVILIAGIVAIGFALPSEYSVSRSIVIKASPSDIYPHIADFKRWKHWGVWFERDSNMLLSYSGEANTIGHKSSWQSETQGNGEMVLKELKPEYYIKYDLRFPDMNMSSVGEMTLTETENGTRVVWKDSGDVNYDLVGRYFVLFIDDLLGPDFEAGLNNLKEVVERK